MNLIQFLEENGRDGLTWAEIGERFGISGEAARSQWRRHSETEPTAYPMAERPSTPPTPNIPPATDEDVPRPPSWLAPGAKAWQSAGGKWLYSGEVISDFDMEETFEKLAKYLPNSNAPSIKDVPHGEDILCVFTSDKHVGADIPANCMFKDMQYNEGIFRARMMAVADLIIERSKQSGGFRELVLFDLGDGVDGYEGYTTRGGHKLPQNMTSQEQFDVYVRVHLDFFQKLIDNDAANLYTFIGASNSNHGGAFDYVCMRALAMLLESKYGVESKIFQEFIGAVTIFENEGETPTEYIVTHGKDDGDLKRGLPLKLDDRTRRYIERLLRHWGTAGGNVVFAKGDQHQAAIEIEEEYDYLNVPSILGSTRWTATNFGRVDPGAYWEQVSPNGNRFGGFINLRGVG